ncbi:dTMP kinase [Compostimonas suwonensis]|uniref:Thymidylate kinase n=1 Tax=Compostimonas suwonensis TaxID=1048394 RepID=A0A2M9BBY1_9MICO|nr:dTMP kinase [Compostimonas suwonensis]PJJ55432.1 dTMP kinase [Compostimonas suwonensis]
MTAAAASGLFITFEGGDGSGKSTQAALLTDWLEEGGRTVVRSREPGGTDVGNEIREIVLHHRGEITPRAEALLYAADRAHHIATKIRPAIDRGDIVIQDRYLDSSVAYQGAGRVLDATQVRMLSLWAAEDLLPDLTILLDLDETRARGRLDAARTRYDRLEAEAGEFHARVRAAYLDLAAAEPGRFLVLDATEPVERIAERIRDRVGTLLAREGSGATGAGGATEAGGDGGETGSQDAVSRGR